MIKLGELAQPITTTFQLFGKYLELRELGIDSVNHAELFYNWVKTTKIAVTNRAALVRAIAEKSNILFPGIYNGDLYEPLPDAGAADAADAVANAAAAADAAANTEV